MTNRKSKINSLTFNIVILFFTFYILILIYRNISSSVFLQRKDKINLVFYSNRTKLYSFDKNNVNYLVSFPSDMEVLVPGGYGYYKVGSLAKLADLEKDQEIFKKAFSATASTPVDLYFYPSKTVIYYDEEALKGTFPSVKEILLSRSNGNLIDRLFVLLTFLKTDRNDYHLVTVGIESNDENSGYRLEPGEIFKENLGIFFNESYRKLGTNVQILYSQSYTTAANIGQILEGAGIRVVDISESGDKLQKCKVIWKKPDPVGSELIRYFGCDYEKGEATVSDIIFILGDIEDKWTVK